MIPQRDLSLIANDLFKEHGGRRVPEAVIERDYVLAWFLTGLAHHPIKAALAFKGGTALRRCWYADYRFSEDLDFTLLQDDMTLEAILAGFDEIFAWVEKESGIHLWYQKEDRHGHQNTHTFYLGYQGPLPAENSVKVDITIKEVLCRPPIERPILRTYERFHDLPEGPTINVYAREEIIVEKLVALSDKARTEPRDLYDLYTLLGERDIVLAELQPDLEAKLAHRERELTGLADAVAAKEARLRKTWTARLQHQMSDLPPFEEVFRAVQRHVREAKLA